MNFDMELGRYVEIAESAVNSNLGNLDDNIVAEAMRYSLSGGGKKLRPVILLASAGAFGGQEKVELARPFAAAIEMIHTYSLIHDDLPAMDDDDYRRGRLSCHKKYGEAYAVLAGDALLNLAFETIFLSLTKLEYPEIIKRHSEAALTIATASGINGMVSGQTADIFYENKEINEQTLIDINMKKTGALISASFEAGAIVGGAEKKHSKAFAEAGMKIGVAFQIRDDILDIEGSFESLGKLTGSDEKNNKTTYVTILGKQKCSERITELTDEALKLIMSTGVDAEFLSVLIRKLASRDK